MTDASSSDQAKMSLSSRPNANDPLNFSQQWCWLLDQWELNRALYASASALQLTGELDLATLRTSLNALAQRHPALRTTFSSAAGQTYQASAPTAAIALPLLDLQALPQPTQAVPEQVLRSMIDWPSDLARGPLLRAVLLRSAPTERVLLLIVQRIVCDRRSEALLVRELVALYAARAGQPAELPALPSQYNGFAAQQTIEPRDAVIDDLTYWQAQLAEPQLLDLPSDYARPAVRSMRGARQSRMLAASLVASLAALGQREEVTQLMIMLAAFAALLRRYSGQHDIVIGTPSAGYDQPELAGVIGCFTAALPLRIDLSGNPTFRELLARVRAACLRSAKRDLPFEHLAEVLSSVRDTRHSPLFQVAYGLNRPALALQQLPGLTVRQLELDSWTAEVDLTLGIIAEADQLHAVVEYSTDLFAATTMARLLGHLATLLTGCAADADRRIDELPLLTASEQQQLRYEWNASARAYPRDQTFPALFAAQVARAPDRVVAVCDTRPPAAFGVMHLTYAALDTRANQLAHILRQRGVTPDSFVGLCFDRSLTMLVGMLAILKAGAAYVPLDPAYPAERLTFILHDTNALLVLTQSSLAARLPLPPSRLLCLDRIAPALAQQPAEPPPLDVRPEQLAYVIYTSGSTGRPKGVMVRQQGLLNLCYGLRSFFDDPAVAHTALIASINFDISVNQIFPTLLFGRTLHIIPDAIKYDSRALRDYLDAAQIELIDAVPSYLDALLRELAPARLPNRLRYLLIGGEQLETRLVQAAFRQLGAQLTLVNIYGLTEISDINIFATISAEAAAQPISLTTPLQNNRIYLTDRAGQLQPIGVIGEVCIAGESLARGYVGQPGLTATRFIPNPFAEVSGAGCQVSEDKLPDTRYPTPDTRLCHTGDLGRRRADGRIEILGRLDQQVKIRGYRIELGEIEALLARQAGVGACVVLAREDRPGDRQLVAYYVPHGAEAPTTSALRRGLQTQLPDFMLPTAFVALDALPKTPNGKIDRRALPAPSGRPTLDNDFVAPRTPLEQLVAGLWATLLDLPDVGLHDRFVDLGGHSLLATRIAARLREMLNVEVPLQHLFATTVAELVAFITTQRQDRTSAMIPPLRPQPRPPDLPLSFAQQRLWFLDQWTLNAAAYTIPEALRLRGPLDLAALHHSLARIVARHEALRTCFPTLGDHAIQEIASQLRLPLPLLDLQALPAASRQFSAEQLAVAAIRQPFDLARLPLIRAWLLRLAPEEHLLILALHHSSGDGWSIGVLFRELAAHYNAFAQQPDPLPPLPIQYADFALWQRQWLHGTAIEQQLSYWRSQLANLPVLDLPTDHPRPAAQSLRGALLPFQLGHERTLAVRAFSLRHGVTLFMTLLAAFNVLLARYSGQSDIVVGTPIANRSRVELEELIGFFVNTLVLRSDLRGQPRVDELLTRIRALCLDAYAHQDLPFERLVEELQPERSLSHTPLVQVVLALQPAPATPALAGVTVQREVLDPGTAQFDLTLLLEETATGLQGQLEYATDLFEATTMARLRGHFLTLLDGMLAQPARHIDELPLLTASEQQQLRYEWNASARAYPRDQTFPALFAAQVTRAPDRVVAVCDTRPPPALGAQSANRAAPAFGVMHLTYAALDTRANQLAHILRQRGVTPDSFVGLCFDRSLTMLVGMLAILKAGAAYVPLDPAYPAERLTFILHDTHALLVLTQSSLVARLPLPPSRLLCLDRIAPALAQQPAEPPPLDARPEQLAYVIYTSGSTGRPKGVMVRQQGLLNLCYGLRSFFDDPAVAHTALIASINFDISVNQIFPTLLFGRTLHIIPDAIKYDSRALRDYLDAAQIELIDAVPSYLDALLRELAPAQLPNRLRYLLIGGEQLETRLVQAAFRQLGAQLTLVNIYGLTEISDINIFATISADAAAQPISLTTPLQNNRIYLTDRAGQLQPIGVIGEVCIAGESLARGYVGQPGLTATRFIPNRFVGDKETKRQGEKETSSAAENVSQSAISNLQSAIGERMCHTGDLGRRRADGRIEILGRLDQQVKIHGYRIELGEIEALLARQAGVGACVVIAREDRPGDRLLVAYIVAKAGRAPTPEQLRRFLKQQLPEYMVPVAFVFLDALPQTPNNKIDRRALPAPDQSALHSSERVLPRTPLETVLADIWAEVLGIDSISVNETFFNLGGHSLRATQVVSRVNQVFRIDLPVRTLFEAPTLAELASHMIATETRPGVVEKTAEILQRIRRMSSDDMRLALEQKKQKPTTSS